MPLLKVLILFEEYSFTCVLMKGDNKNQGIVWRVSVMVIATYLSSDSTIVKGIENTRKCEFFNFDTLSSASEILMLIIPSLWNVCSCTFAVKM